MATRETGTTTNTAVIQQMHTDVAVLQAHMGHIDEKVQEVRNDVKSIESKMEQNHLATAKLFKELREDNAEAHKEVTDKITALEKWKWMVMGGSMALGALGFDVITKLLF